jgi:hypothetical protein
MFNDRRKVFLLKLATPSVLIASPLRRCSFWWARRQALPVAAHLHPCLYKSLIPLHPRSQSGTCEWTKRKYLARTTGSAGAVVGRLAEGNMARSGVMRFALGALPASSPTVLLSARSRRGRTLRFCIKVCLPSRPPFLPSGNACFRLTLVASSSILLHYNNERSAQDCRGRISDSKRRWLKEPLLAEHVGPIQNSDIQRLGFLAAFTAVSLQCSFSRL